MKSVSIREMNENVSKTLREAQHQPVLVRHGDKPAVWMVSAADIARLARNGSSDDVYSAVLEAVAVRLFEDGSLTMGQAARFLGLTVDDFIDLCARLRVSVVAETGRGVTEQLDSFDRWLSSSIPPDPS